MHADSTISSLRGVFVHFNLSPKGVPEGMLIRPNGDAATPLVQVNFPPELAGQMTDLIDEGDVIAIDLFPFRDAEPEAHPVFDLIRITTTDGRTLTAEGAPEVNVRVEGTVIRINFARRGEANGALLDTGDFVHLRPHGVKAIGLELGQTLVAEGDVRAGWSGHRVIEARVANGITIEKPKHGHKHGPKHDDGHHDHHGHHRHEKHAHGPKHAPGPKRHAAGRA